MKHLWEVEHPYYMNDGNYFRRGDHVDYRSWDGFLSDWGYDSLDIELNRIHRFDASDAPDCDIEKGYFEITFYRVIQRKGFCMSQSVYVPKSREQEVIDYLLPYYAQEKAIWAPFSDTATTEPEGQSDD